MRVALTVLFAATAWVGAVHAQKAPPAPAPAQAPIPRTELAPPNNPNKQTITHVCTDNEDLSLTGSNDRVTLSGACHSMVVRGSGNTIIAAQLLDLDVTGDNNTASWPRSPGEPHLNFVGTGNSAGPQKN